MKKLLFFIGALSLGICMTSCVHTNPKPVHLKKKVIPVVPVPEQKPQVVLATPVEEKTPVVPKSTDLVINGILFPDGDENLYTWATVPHPDHLIQEAITSYTNEKGDTHYYQVVRVKNEQLSWYQMAALAEDAGGYLACLTDKGENDFVYSLIKDASYWSQLRPYHSLIGPAIGGYQLYSSKDPVGNWRWVSGEKMTWTNWTQNKDDGVLDNDPRNNTQPNDSPDSHFIGQSVMAFGALSVPVSTWGDLNPVLLKQNGANNSFKAFIIEYPTNPTVRI